MADPRYDHDLRERISTLRGEGKSVRKIAETVERSPTRVHAILVELGLDGPDPTTRKPARDKETK